MVDNWEKNGESKRKGNKGPYNTLSIADDTATAPTVWTQPHLCVDLWPQRRIYPWAGVSQSDSLIIIISHKEGQEKRVTVSTDYRRWRSCYKCGKGSHWARCKMRKRRKQMCENLQPPIIKHSLVMPIVFCFQSLCMNFLIVPCHILPSTTTTLLELV